MSKYISNSVSFAKARKSASILIGAVILYGGYLGYQKFFVPAAPTQYVIASAQKSTIVVSITGTGQVSAASQIDITPKVSGTIVYLAPITSGQAIGAGTLIAEIDSMEAEKAVRDAQINLDNAKLSLTKLNQPADQLSLVQAQNALDQSKSGLQNSYDTASNNLSNVYLDLPGTMTVLQNILYGTDVNKNTDNASAYNDMVRQYNSSVQSYHDDAIEKYQAALSSYNTSFGENKTVGQFNSTSTTERLANKTYQTTKDIAEAVKSANDFLNFVKDWLTERSLSIPTILNTHLGQLNTYTGKNNADVSMMFSGINGIITAKQNLAEKTQAFIKLQAGANPLDIQSSELSVEQRQNALKDANDTLANYYIHAPFDGTVGKINAQKFGNASPGTALATLITKDQFALVSLNEVDATKIKVGDKATLTFDAIDSLTLTGKVAQIDALGTVSQGVVTYSVKISFDTSDSRIKPGMSATAAIITDVKSDVLTIPSSALKTKGENSFVQVFDQKFTIPQGDAEATISSQNSPHNQNVQTGLSNDTETEITGGLSDGDQVVVRTVNVAQTGTQTQTPSLLNSITGNRSGAGGSGNVRVPGVGGLGR